MPTGYAGELTVKATINGQEYTLAYDAESSSYKTTITAPTETSYNENDGHYYAVEVKATDGGGNTTTVNDTHPTLGDSCKLRVLEKVKPSRKLIYPTAGAHVGPNPLIKFEVKDSGSGINPDTIKLSIGPVGDFETVTDGITKEPIMFGDRIIGYECTYQTSGLTFGQYFYEPHCEDYDGNTDQGGGYDFIIDSTPPVLNITSPEDNLVTNQSTITVTGTTSDATSAPVTLTINDEPVVVGEDGAFSHQVTLTDGANTITIVATDAAGQTTTVTRHVTLDSGAPVIHSITITPNPVDAGATYIISVVVTDD